MSPELQLLIVTALFLGLLMAGMAVPFAITVPALLYLLLQGGLPALNSLGLVSWGSMNSFVLTTVPLFMLMAEILSLSGLSNRIYRGLEKLVARLPGGLLQTNIAGCAIFASRQRLEHRHRGRRSAASALPQLSAANTIARLAAGSLAAGGTLGILIPPSFPMIVYGTFTETSVPKLFIAGIIPGLIMTALFMALHRRACHDRAGGRAARGRRALPARAGRRRRRGGAVLRADRRAPWAASISAS